MALVLSKSNSNVMEVGGYTSDIDPWSLTSHRNSEAKAPSTGWGGRKGGGGEGEGRGVDIVRTEWRSIVYFSIDMRDV